MKKLITEDIVLKILKSGNKIISAGKNEIITPLAMDRIKREGMIIVQKDSASEIDFEESEKNHNKKLNKIAIGCDHTGYKMKNIISEFLIKMNYEIIDVGTYGEESCDFPDFAFAVAQKVALKEVDFGIMFDATGIPSAITANKVNRIRAATCYNEFSARSSREHNDANVLVLGAKTLGEETIKSIVKVWLETSFGGGRHQKRLNKISAIELKEKNK